MRFSSARLRPGPVNALDPNWRSSRRQRYNSLSGQQTPEDRLEVCALASRSSVRDLVEYPPHVLVTLGRTAAAVLLGALFFPGASPYPGIEFRCREKRAGCDSDFGNHLLCRVDAETRNLRQANDCLLMRFMACAIAVLSGASAHSFAKFLGAPAEMYSSRYH